jgi:hypothetical protein
VTVAVDVDSGIGDSVGAKVGVPVGWGVGISVTIGVGIAVSCGVGLGASPQAATVKEVTRAKAAVLFLSGSGNARLTLDNISVRMSGLY